MARKSQLIANNFVPIRPDVVQVSFSTPLADGSSRVDSGQRMKRFVKSFRFAVFDLSSWTYFLRFDGAELGIT